MGVTVISGPCPIMFPLSSCQMISVPATAGAKVIFSTEPSDGLLGARLNPDSLSKLQEVCEKAANPIDDKRGTIEFRRKVAGVLAKRAVEKAYKRIMEDS